MPIPNHGCTGTCEKSDPVESPLGAHLLDHADQHIAEDHTCGHDCVAQLAESDERNTEGEQHIVDERTDVLAADT